MTQRMTKTLENTRFKGCPIVAVAARPGAESGTSDSIGLDDLMQVRWACNVVSILAKDNALWNISVILVESYASKFISLDLSGSMLVATC